MIRAAKDDRGVILIALLWILVALSVIALSFSRESFVEVAVARNARDMGDAYYVARAGIAATVYRLMEKRYTTPPVQGVELPGPPDALELGELQGEFGGGSFKVEIQDESGKISLNIVGEEYLRSLVESVGIGKPDSDVIVDSLMDWRDVDTAHRINGAEDAYYQALARPYKAKNGRIESVEELLLVRGVTRDYFYSHREKGADGSPVSRYGLSRYFTAYYNSNRVNVNSAPLQVLMAIPGMPPQAAEHIYQRRKTKPYKTQAEITQDVAVPLPPTVAPLLSTDTTGVYTLTASAHMKGSKVQRVIRCVVNLDPREPNWYRILYWNENVPNL
jgi:general secretion pathway protein K